jgi:hypothetical protein
MHVKALRGIEINLAVKDILCTLWKLYSIYHSVDYIAQDLVLLFFLNPVCGLTKHWICILNTNKK